MGSLAASERLVSNYSGMETMRTANAYLPHYSLLFHLLQFLDCIQQRVVAAAPRSSGLIQAQAPFCSRVWVGQSFFIVSAIGYRPYRGRDKFDIVQKDDIEVGSVKTIKGAHDRRSNIGGTVVPFLPLTSTFCCYAIGRSWKLGGESLEDGA